MSKNIILNGQTFNNASYLETETTDGNKALFRETSEITTPSGSMEIAENGTFDVTNFAQAIVNVVGGASTGQPITGFVETKAMTKNYIDLPIGEVDADKFLVLIELVETGDYATAGDSSSELTMNETIKAYSNTEWMLAYYLYVTNPFNQSVVYDQALIRQFVIRGAITLANKNAVALESGTQTYENGVLRIGPFGYLAGGLSKYCKYAYTVYPLG